MPGAAGLPEHRVVAGWLAEAHQRRCSMSPASKARCSPSSRPVAVTGRPVSCPVIRLPDGSERSGRGGSGPFPRTAGDHYPRPDTDRRHRNRRELWQALGARSKRWIRMSTTGCTRAPVICRICWRLPICSASSPEHLHHSGGGFRDFSRIGASDPDMWSAIFDLNRDALLEVTRISGASGRLCSRNRSRDVAACAAADRRGASPAPGPDGD